MPMIEERMTTPEEPVAATEETPTETVTETTTAEVAPSVEELQMQLAQARSEAEDYRERWLRVLADYQNFRKRVMQERVDAYNEGKKEAVLTLLPVLDNLERALASLHDGADLQAYRQGLELIVRLFHEALRRLDVEPIPAVGQPFNPHWHEAFERVEREDVTEGTIVGEIERGYRMGERVIRPAKVQVAVKPLPPLQPVEPSPAKDEESRPS